MPPTGPLIPGALLPNRPTPQEDTMTSRWTIGAGISELYHNPAFACPACKGVMPSTVAVI